MLCLSITPPPPPPTGPPCIQLAHVLKTFKIAGKAGFSYFQATFSYRYIGGFPSITGPVYQIENSLVEKSGPFHLIKLLSFFYPTNVNWQLDQTKKTQRSPVGDRTRVFRLPVGRSNHWATKPRQELRTNFCLSPTVSSFFTTRWPECSVGLYVLVGSNTRVTS